MPRIDDDKIVWKGGPWGYIFLYDIATGNITQISKIGARPDIQGDMIVCDSWVGGLQTDIFLYNISTKEIRRITDSSDNDQEPKIDDDNIVWIAHDG